MALCVWNPDRRRRYYKAPDAHNWITEPVHAAVNYGMVQKELTHSPLPGSFRCDARATVRRDPVCLQRGCLPRQSPALLRLQLRVDRPATWYRLRQLPVSSPFLEPCEHPVLLLTRHTSLGFHRAELEFLQRPALLAFIPRLPRLVLLLLFSVSIEWKHPLTLRPCGSPCC